MDISGVPKEYNRPVPGRSKYLFCKDLFDELREDDPGRAEEIVRDIATYIIESERFDRRLQAEGRKHLPVFKSFIRKAGFTVPLDRSIKANPIFHARKFIPNSKLCFILMPFTPDWAVRIYNKVLLPIIEKCGLEVQRADNLFGHNVMEDVWSAINSAFIVIADVTGRNPNVFYELGIAHTLGKNVIILTQNKDDVPFDIQHFRYILYADNKDGYETLEDLLPKFIKQFYSPQSPLD
jgi:hypothetical protein